MGNEPETFYQAAYMSISVRVPVIHASWVFLQLKTLLHFSLFSTSYM